MNLNRIFILTLFDLRHNSLRVKGLMFLLPFLLYWLAISRVIKDGGADFITSQFGNFVTSRLLSVEIMQIMFIDNPPVLSLCLFLGLITLPLFCILAGHNQLAGDAGRYSFRFLLTRCTRIELYLSRYLGSCILVGVSLFILVIGMAVLSLQIDQFTPSATITYAMKIYIVLLIYSLPLIAFIAIISAYMLGALSALLCGGVLYIVMLVASRWLDDDFPPIAYLLPNVLKPSLYDVGSNELIVNLAGLLAFTVIYLAIGWFIFRQRNV